MNKDEFIEDFIDFEYTDTNKSTRKKQLFDKLNSLKLTYIEGGVCDAYIKFGYPSLDQVVLEIQHITLQEEKRLNKLLIALKKHNLEYDPNVMYYKEYVEQGTCLKTAISEGAIEWFYLNKTDYLDILNKTLDEDKAREIALDRYIDKHGQDEYVKKYTKKTPSNTKKIMLY